MKKSLQKSWIRSFDGGYTLLFAVLTSALVLGIAVFIVSTTTKQYELSAAARNSVASFYAADAGIECAAYAFSNGLIDSATGASITCNNVTISGVSFQSISAGAGDPPIFSTGSTISRTPLNAFNFNTGNGTCANIVIYDGIGSDGIRYTFIDSRGYNRCSSSNGPDTTSSATVERALRLGKRG